MKEKTNKTESQKKRENNEKAANGRVLMAHLKGGNRHFVLFYAPVLPERKIRT